MGELSAEQFKQIKAERIVQGRHKNAVAKRVGDKNWIIRECSDYESFWAVVLGKGATPSMAWADAAKRVTGLLGSCSEATPEGDSDHSLKK